MSNSKMSNVSDESNMSELWDNKTLGCDINFATECSVSIEEEEELDKSLGLKLIKFRLEELVYNELEIIAKGYGMKLEELIKNIIPIFIESHNNLNQKS